MSAAADDVTSNETKEWLPWTPPTEVDFYSRMLSAIKKKGYETYAISRILHRLDDPDIELVTQQAVRLDNGKLALLDLYLPQFGIGVEIDEEHHFSEGSVEADKLREKAIVRVTESHMRRIRVKNTDPLITLTHLVDALIADIQKWKEEAVTTGAFTPFVYGHRHDPAHWRNVVGKVRIGDDIQMHSTADVCALFGKDYKLWRQGVLALPDAMQVWMPTLDQEGVTSRRDWKNQLTRDGKTIVQTQLRDGNFTPAKEQPRSIVFAKFKDPVFTTQYYRFLGVFEVVKIDGRKTTLTRLDGDAGTEVDLTPFADSSAHS